MGILTVSIVNLWGEICYSTSIFKNVLSFAVMENARRTEKNIHHF